MLTRVDQVLVGVVVEMKRGSETLGPFNVADRPIRIGREAASNDIVLRDAYISRRHAQIEVRDGSFWVVDLSSSNGTFLNGIRLDEQNGLAAPLRDGDSVLIGTRELVFRAAWRDDQPAIFVREESVEAPRGDGTTALKGAELTRSRPAKTNS